MSSTRPCVVLFGDSITERAFEPGGWGARVLDARATRCDALCRGFAGFNTRWARAVAPRVLPPTLAPRVALATVFFGANDAVLPRLAGDWSRQHVPRDEYAANVAAIVRHMRRAFGAACAVVVIGPPPVDELAWHTRTRDKWRPGEPLSAVPCNRSLAAAQAYSAAAQRAAAAVDAPFVDLCAAMLARDDWRSLLSDGLHLAPRGAELLHAELERVLGQVQPTPLSSECFATELPHHSEIDVNNWEEALGVEKCDLSRLEDEIKELGVSKL